MKPKRKRLNINSETLKIVVGGQPRQSESCVHSDCCLPYTPQCVATTECQVTDECGATWNCL